MIRGVKTSEFWAVALSIAASLGVPALSQTRVVSHPIALAGIIGPLAAAVYALARSWVKVAETRIPGLAPDLTALTARIGALEATVKASPALSAEQAAILSRMAAALKP